MPPKALQLTGASVRIGADDATGREELARDLIRAPFSGERISFNVAALAPATSCCRPTVDFEYFPCED